MPFQNNYPKYLIILPTIILLWTACQRSNYRVDTSQTATLTFYAFRIYQHEKLQLLVNGKEVLFDSVNTVKDRYYYLRYLNLSMAPGTSVTFRSSLKDSTLIDTSFNVTDKFGRYSLSLSAPYPANISIDSLKRMRIPFKYGSLSIPEARRVAVFEADTSDFLLFTRK